MTVSSEKVEDLSAIIPVDGEFTVDGITAVVKRLKAKEFLQLVRVLTIGLGPNVANVDLSSGTEDEVQSRVIALFVMAIPEAIDEFGQFLFSVVDAKDPKQRGELVKAMENPDIEVLMDVISLIAIQEKDDLRSLVGKAKAALTRIQSVYRPSGK